MRYQTKRAMLTIGVKLLALPTRRELGRGFKGLAAGLTSSVCDQRHKNVLEKKRQWEWEEYNEFRTHSPGDRPWNQT